MILLRWASLLHVGDGLKPAVHPPSWDCDKTNRAADNREGIDADRVSATTVAQTT